MKENHSKYRISNLNVFFLISIAIVIDLITLIPFVGTFIAIPAGFGFGLYFYFKGLGILNTKRLTSQVVGMIGELIPAIQALPCFTLGIALAIYFSRIEDKTGINLFKATNITKVGTSLPKSTQ